MMETIARSERRATRRMRPPAIVNRGPTPAVPLTAARSLVLLLRSLARGLLRAAFIVFSDSVRMCTWCT